MGCLDSSDLTQLGLGDLGCPHSCLAVGSISAGAMRSVVPSALSPGRLIWALSHVGGHRVPKNSSERGQVPMHKCFLNLVSRKMADKNELEL